jgi:hypothetical protein
MKEQFRNLQIIFLGLLLGQLAFAVVANYVMINGVISDTGTLIYLVPAVMIGGTVAGFYIFNANLKKFAASESTLEAKFVEYRKNLFVRWAMLEIGSLLAIIAAIIEAKSVYFALSGLGLLVFSTTRPDILDFSKRFELKLADEQKLK